MRWRRGALAFLFVAGLVAPVAHASPACADAPNQTALIIDTGSTVERRCVAFSEAAISGKDLLDRAAVGAVYKEYAYGAAVCSLLGVGNTADDCLGERSGSHWSYFRAKKAASMFTLASQGVSTTEVKDGDVEGWRWKTGVPPYSPADTVCAATASTTLVDATIVPPSPSPNPTNGVGVRPPNRQPDTDTSGTANEASTTASSMTVDLTSTTTARQLALPVDDDDGGSPVGVAAVGALIVGFGGAAWWVSRRRAAGG